jgi:hypothetical protein
VAVLGLLVIGSVLAASPRPSYAATRTVSTTGADVGDCIGSPCLTIGYALSQAANGDTIVVGAGVFVEQLTIAKSVTIVGAGASATSIKAPNSLTVSGLTSRRSIVEVSGGVTVSMTGLTVTGPTDGSHGCSDIHHGIFVVGGSSLTISNATVTEIRATPALSGCQMGIAIRAGMQAIGQTGTLAVSDVTFTNYTKGAIVVDNTGSSGTITRAIVTGVGLVNNAQNGVQISRGATGTVRHSIITNHQCNAPSCGPDPINDTYAFGILLYQAGSGILIEGNTITGNDSGIYFGATGALARGNFLGSNRWSGLFFDEGANAAELNTVAGGNEGVLVAAYSGNVTNTVASLLNTHISGATTGIRLIDEDGSDSAVPQLTVSNSSITGNSVGIANPTGGTATATGNWWGCPGGPGQPGCDTISGAVNAGSPLASMPLTTRLVASTGFNAGNCAAVATPCAALSYAETRAFSGETIQIGAGTYLDAATITKNNLTITGAGATSTIIMGPKSGGNHTIEINGSGNTIQHLQITRDGNNPTDWASNTRNQGVTFHGSNNTLQNVLITKNRTGVLFAAGSGNKLLNSTVTNNRTGLHFINNASSGAIVKYNQITNNWTIGVLFREDTSNQHTINDNVITGNWYSQVEDRGNPQGIVRNISRNFFGTTAITVFQAQTSGEPGYTSQIPVEFGGTATPPANPKLLVVNTVCTVLSSACTDPGGIGTSNPNRLDYSPYLVAGTNNPLGFTGDYSQWYVDAASPAWDGTPMIPEAVSLVTIGGTITAVPGYYNEFTVVTKTVTLRGAQHGVDARTRSSVPEESVLTSSAGAFDIDADNVVIDGFTFQNQTAGQGTAVYLRPTRSGHVVQNNIFTQNTFGLYLNASGATPSIVRRNRFVNNNQPGSASGNGIYSDQGATSILIEENTFTQQDNAAIVFTAVPPTLNSGITIRNNAVITSSGIALYYTTNVTVTGNTISGAQASGVTIGGGVTTATVSSNSFIDGEYRGVAIFDLVSSPNSNIILATNAFTQSIGALQLNRPAIEVAAASTVDVLSNTFTFSGSGIVTEVQGIVVGGGATTGVTIRNNRLTASGVSGLTEFAAIKLKNDLSGSATVAIRNNLISGFLTGIFAAGLSNGAGITVVDNSLGGNTTAFSNTGAPITAEGNWWGSFRGPTTSANPGGNGSGLSGAVDFSPWLGDGTNVGGNPGFIPNQTPKYGLAAVLLFVTQPAHTGTFQQPLTTQPVVRAEDGLGHLAINFQGAVTLSPNPPSGVTGAAVTGPNPVNATDGLAPLSGIGVNHAGTGWTLTASASGLTSATSAPFDVAKVNQTITFAALPNKLTTDPPFPVTATASSGLPVSFAAVGQCTLAGTTVTLTGAGACAIVASQNGNGDFHAADPVARLFQISAPSPIGPATSIQVTATPIGDVRADPGATVFYSVTVVNQTGQPGAFDFGNVSDSSAFPMSGLPVSGVSIAAGGSATQRVGIVIPATATRGQLSINKVRVSTTQGAVTYEQTVDLIAVVNEGAPDLRVRISRTPSAPEAGTLVRYTVTYTSPVRSSPNVVLMVTLPSSQLIEFVSATDGLTPDANGVLSWPSVASVPANGSVTKEVVVRVKPGVSVGSLLRLRADVTTSVSGQGISGESSAVDDSLVGRRVLMPFASVRSGSEALRAP